MHADRSRAESFGAVAAAYDRYRPSYPDALMDDLAARRPAHVLDVGCGTGKAAVQLAARGLDVLGLEVDARMAEVARAHGIPVEVGTFEAWADDGRRFDLITAAQSWHWVEPEAGAAKAASLLRRGGRLAAFWNHDMFDTNPDAVPEISAAYREHAPDLAPSVPRPVYRTIAEELARGGLFSSVTTHEYPWEKRYSAEQWVGFVSTHSDHLALPPDRLHSLGAALTDVIEGLGGTLDVHGATHLIVART